MTTPRPKLDIPFSSDEEILNLVSQFEARSWPYERWTHRAHLAVAIVYLNQLSFSEALARVRKNIQAYNRASGGDPDGYHETITVFFLSIVAAHLSQSGHTTSLHDIVNRLFDLYDMKTLAEYYSSDRLWSAQAKSSWLEPDLKPLPGRPGQGSRIVEFRDIQ